ncbi:DUF1254 domain-containing protein [Rhizobium beringeri]
MNRYARIQAVVMSSLLSAATAAANQSAPQFKAEVPASIQTPGTVQTRIGTLNFADGLPDQAAVQKVYDNIDFSRGVEAFLSGMPAASVYAMCEGLADAGAVKNKGIGITENLLDARSLFLTANTTTVYVFFCVDLSNGPVVAQVPPGVLGPVDDAFSAMSRTSASSAPTRAREESIFSCRRDTRVDCPPTATSSRSLRPIPTSSSTGPS